ncbi:MAG: hypothetical protein ACTSRA_20155, partial [Promethearchaeota archaeon]
MIGGKIVTNYFAKKEKELQDNTKLIQSKISIFNKGQTEPIKSTGLSFNNIGDPASIQDKIEKTELKPVVDSSKSIIFHPGMMLLYGMIGARMDALSIWLPIGAFQYSQIIFFWLGISLAIHLRSLTDIQKHCKWT